MSVRVRIPTPLRAATDDYGSGSAEYNAVSQAWDSVGVPAEQIDGSTFFVALPLGEGY